MRWVIHEKLVVAQLVNKLPAFNGTPNGPLLYPKATNSAHSP
jgi:hypothetical protein